MRHAPLAQWTILAYGLPGLVAALPIIPVAVLLPEFYAREVGLGFALVGIALAAARVFDFFSDALVGWWADRFEWRGYRYKHLVVLGMAMAGVALFRLALPPIDAGALYLWWWSIVLFTGWTVVMVPYTAWGAELSTDVHERSKLAASREIAGVVGMIAAVGAPLLGSGDVDAAGALALMAIAAAAVGLPALLLLLLSVPEPGGDGPRARVRPLDLARLLRFAPFRRTLTCWFLNGIANGLPAVLFPLVVGDYFGLDRRMLHVLLVCYFAAAFLAAPAWLALARDAGKVRAWCIAIALNMLVFSQVLWLSPEHATWFIAVCILSGATLGADLALPASLQADVMEADRRVNAVRRTASAFALWSMATKLALALAVGSAFVVLGVAGGVDAAAGSLPVATLLTLYVGVPLLLKGMVLVLLRKIPGLLTGLDRHATAESGETAAEHGNVLVEPARCVPVIDVQADTPVAGKS